MAPDREVSEPEYESSTRQTRRAQTRADEKLLKQALDCFKQANEADGGQRQRELDDLDFDAGNHWPKELLDARGPVVDKTTGRKLPGRPSLTIPKLDGPIQQVINQQTAAALGIRIKPKSSGATKDTAEKINGLIRHIQVESGAQLARGWAYQRAVKCGRGYYRILKDWANDGDWDIDLIVARILNQASVYLDPYHQKPDASDMEWAFIVEDLPLKRFEREHGKSKIVSPRTDVDELRGIGDASPGWLTFGEDGALKSVRRAEYWRIVYVEKELIETEAGWRGLEEERPDDDMSKIVRRRTVRDRKVKWVKMTATEILDREEWEGRYIPIVQVLGREYNVNGKRIYKGMVTNGKDAQRSYNYMRSKQVEAVGLAPVAPYTMVEGQDEGYEDMWANANTVPYARLIYKPVSIGGKPAPAPQRTSASTDIGAITIAAQAADEDLKSITGFSDPSLGRSNPADRSGRAITALQQRTEAATSDYLENLTQISMVHEGRILLDLLPHVYDRPGRVASVLDEDLETTSQVILNQPYLPAPSPDGVPQPAAAGTPGAKLIDLATGVYRVVVSVSKSFKTQRDEAVALLGELIAANPQTAPLVTDVLVDNVDAPGFSRLAKRFRAMLPPQIIKMEAGESDLPPAAAALVSNLEQQLDATKQQMQQMGQALESKQQEVQAKQELEMLKLEREYELKLAELATKEKIEIEKVRAGLSQAEISAQGKQSAEELRAVERRLNKEADLRHDAITQDTQRAHEAAQAELDRNVERQKIDAQRSAAKAR
jgi:hypothetical protein